MNMMPAADREVTVQVVLNVATFWDIEPCTSSHLLQAGSFFGGFSTLKMEVMRSSETSVHVWTTGCYISQDGNI
jgi:hypothetical protein